MAFCSLLSALSEYRRWRWEPNTNSLAGAWDAEITPDGVHAVLLGADGAVEVWRIDSRSRVASTTAGPPRETDEPMDANAVSPDSRTLATRDGGNGLIRLWNLPDLTPLGELSAPGPASPDPELAYARPSFLDADRLLVRRVIDLTVWSARSGDRLGATTELPREATYVHAAADGDELVVTASDGRTRRYSIAEGRELPGSGFRHGEPDPLVGPIAVGHGLVAIARTGRWRCSTWTPASGWTAWTRETA